MPERRRRVKEGERHLASVTDLHAHRAAAQRPTLDRLNALVADELTAVNRLIVERMDSRVALIPQLAGHIIASGGKRIRPMLTLTAAKLCGYAGTRQIGLAVQRQYMPVPVLMPASQDHCLLQVQRLLTCHVPHELRQSDGAASKR